MPVIILITLVKLSFKLSERSVNNLLDLLFENLEPFHLGNRVVKHRGLVVVLQQLLEVLVPRHRVTVFVAEKRVDLSHQDVVGTLLGLPRRWPWLA